MTQVSRRFLNKKAQDKIFNLFVSTIIKCNSKNLAASLIDDLFTPTEKIMISKRISIAYMLMKGQDYRTISQILKVSTATVANIASWLKIKGAGLRKVISEIKEDEVLRDVLVDIEDTLQEVVAGLPGQNWSQSKKMLWQARYNRMKPF